MKKVQAKFVGVNLASARRKVPVSQKACELLSFQGLPGCLALTDERRVPPLQGPGQVMVRVMAASINPLDLMMTRGYGQQVLGVMHEADASVAGLQPSTAFPLCSLGRDFSGEVVEVGAGVTRLKVGDQVWGTSFPTSQGTFQQFSVLEADNLGLKPANLTHHQAAGVPFAGLTAWSAIQLSGGLVRDMRVMVIGAGGAVGGLATQLLAKHFGLSVLGVAGGQTTCDRVEVLGAVDVLDYLEDNYQTKLDALSGTQDLVLDCAGLGSEAARLLPLLRGGGRLVSLTSPLLSNTDSKGLRAGFLATLDNLARLNSGSLLPRFGWAFFRSDLAALNLLARMCEARTMEPTHSRVVPLEQICNAFVELEQGNFKEKVVVDMS